MLTAAEVKAHIVTKAMEDADFRGRVIAEPRAVLEEMGLRFPDGYNIHVHVESETDAHMVLGPRPELSMQELDLISAAHGSWVEFCQANNFC